jgi:hypothetical protein
MTELSMQDHELIRRYLAGSLTDEEESMLETRIVKDPALRSELELTVALKDGLRELKARGEIAGLLARSRDRWRLRMPALAASLAGLAVGLLAVVYFIGRPAPVQPPVTIASLYFERTRGSEAADVVLWTRKSTPTRLRLHLDVGAAPVSSYRVIVQSRNGGGAKPLWDTVEPISTESEVVLDLPDSRLEPGDFQVRLSPASGPAREDTMVYHLVVRDP